ncbi:unnamed protein product [Vitrella brassicaformis CCMP3155]|uniref:Uncharacterized protein n=1 Tax=Vitrella brassicaformis (strain CCMP3155) TaxID=1169540 RepID=A0A0G4G5J4_VITBC|nr:unnamed protein product [Vitrella brassicaformis CCMP3155]|eukprot:CEM23327.1 unnamed protein product [Vitrella brassicaformis CCMP3155]
MVFDFGDVPNHPLLPYAPRAMHESITNMLSTYILSAPPVPINSTCEAPPNHTEVGDDDCTANEKHSGLLSGKRLGRPRKIVDMIYFGYDLDIVEVRFHELRHAVDWFIVGESRLTSTGFTKPLMMTQAVQDPEWFGDLRGRIVVIELPELVMRTKYESNDDCRTDEDCWATQKWARDELMRRFLQLNKEQGYKYVKQDEDLIFASDPDEFPAGDVMKLVKHCEMAKPLENTALVLMSWAGNLNIVMTRMMSLDIPHLPLATAPRGTLIPYKTAKDFKSFFYRTKPPQKLYGGWHITDYNYIPFLFVKYTTFGEGNGQIFHPDSCLGDALFGDPLDKLPSDLHAELNTPLANTTLPDLEPLYRADSWAAAERSSWKTPAGLFNEMAARLVWAQRRMYSEGYTRKVKIFAKYMRKDELGEKYKQVKLRELPWFVRCNPHRFPVLLGNADPRYFQEDRGHIFRQGEAVQVDTMGAWKNIISWDK